MSNNITVKKKEEKLVHYTLQMERRCIFRVDGDKIRECKKLIYNLIDPRWPTFGEFRQKRAINITYKLNRRPGRNDWKNARFCIGFIHVNSNNHGTRRRYDSCES